MYCSPRLCCTGKRQRWLLAGMSHLVTAGTRRCPRPMHPLQQAALPDTFKPPFWWLDLHVTLGSIPQQVDASKGWTKPCSTPTPSSSPCTEPHYSLLHPCWPPAHPWPRPHWGSGLHCLTSAQIPAPLVDQHVCPHSVKTSEKSQKSQEQPWCIPASSNTVGRSSTSTQGPQAGQNSGLQHGRQTLQAAGTRLWMPLPDTAGFCPSKAGWT